jgi:hypothetical protein
VTILVSVILCMLILLLLIARRRRLIWRNGGGPDDWIEPELHPGHYRWIVIRCTALGLILMITVFHSNSIRRAWFGGVRLRRKNSCENYVNHRFGQNNHGR